jgi:hypothetical protein
MTIQDEARDRLDSFGDDDRALVRAMIHGIDQLERLYQQDRSIHRSHHYEKRRMERAFNGALSDLEALLREAAAALPESSDVGARIRARLADLARGAVHYDYRAEEGEGQA